MMETIDNCLTADLVEILTLITIIAATLINHLVEELAAIRLRHQSPAIYAYMKEREIGCVFHYIPLHSSPSGKKFGRFDGEDKFTTKESDRLVRLPLWYEMSDEQVSFVIESAKSFFGGE